MSGAPRNETVVRTTDIVADTVASRLGNTGTDLGDDLVNRINQVLGRPVEVTPASPASKILTVGPSVYTLPDGQRIATMDDGFLPALSTGTVNFGTGNISTGANPTFSLPNLTPGQYVKAVIQYKVDENKVNVSFGTAAGSLAGATVPTLLDGYAPVALVELHSTAGGTGVFDNIDSGSIVKIVGGLRSGKGPLREAQDVTGVPKSVFTLVQVSIPKNRTRLMVLQNGIVLDSGDDYTINSDTQVTLSSAAPVNARLTFLVLS